MSVFAVYLDKGDKDVLSKVRENYQIHYVHSPNLVLLETTDLAATVKMNLGMAPRGDGGTGAIGVVFCLSSNVSGFTKPSLWEWLQAREGWG